MNELVALSLTYVRSQQHFSAGARHTQQTILESISPKLMFVNVTYLSVILNPMNEMAPIPYVRS